MAAVPLAGRLPYVFIVQSGSRSVFDKLVRRRISGTMGADQWWDGGYANAPCLMALGGLKGMVHAGARTVERATAAGLGRLTGGGADRQSDDTGGT